MNRKPLTDVVFLDLEGKGIYISNSHMLPSLLHSVAETLARERYSHFFKFNKIIEIIFYNILFIFSVCFMYETLKNEN